MNSVVRVIVSCAALMLLAPHAALAQEVPIPAAPAQPPAAETNAPTPPPVPPADLLKPAELDALVAPIALYPDDLLSLVLMASTYPLEVVEAQRWLDANKKLSDAQRKAALEKLSWDQSVKSLIATPTVLEMMSTQLTWTRKLGDAVLAQQTDVMDAVQRLRAKARSRDKLVTTKQQRVTVQNTGPRQVIAIEPVDPNLIYVPYYEPAVVYGDWPYADYPPYFFPYGGYLADDVLAGGLWFGAGYALGYWGGGYYWGGRCNWVNNNLYYRNGNRWTHRPEHRRGVGYANDRMQRQFGDRRGGGDRLNFRGRDGRQVVNPNANRGAGADRRAARNGDAVRNRSDGARTGQAGRTRSGQRAAQRNGTSNRSAQRQRFQNGRVANRYSNRGRMDVRGGRNGGFAGRGYAGRGGGDFRANSFRGGGLSGRRSSRVPRRRRLWRRRSVPRWWWWWLPRRRRSSVWWRRRLSRWWRRRRFPWRRWWWRRTRWRWGRPSVRHPVEDRYCAGWPARQRSWLVPLSLSWRAANLCRRDGAGRATGAARCGDPRTRWLSARPLRQDRV